MGNVKGTLHSKLATEFFSWPKSMYFGAIFAMKMIYKPHIRTRPRFLHNAPTPKFHHPMFTHLEVIMLTNTQTNRCCWKHRTFFAKLWHWVIISGCAANHLSRTSFAIAVDRFLRFKFNFGLLRRATRRGVIMSGLWRPAVACITQNTPWP